MSDAAVTTTTTTQPQEGPILADNGGADVNATLLGDTSATTSDSDGASNQSTTEASSTSNNEPVQSSSAGQEASYGLAPLPENANEDQRADFDKKLRALNGTPGTVEEYGTFGFDEGVIDTNSEDYKYYSKLFYEIGLNKAQAKKLLEGHQKYASEMVAFQKKQNDEVVTEYRRKVRNDFVKELGGEAQFNEFNQTAIRGFKAASAGAGLSEKDMKGMLNVMGDDPRFVRIFNAIGKMHSEDVLVTGTHAKAQEKTFDTMFSEMFKASND